MSATSNRTSAPMRLSAAEAAAPCIFCAILAGRAPASIVLNEPGALAFLSLEQPNPYKVLVVPREHVETIFDLNDAQAAALFQAAVRAARAVRAVSGCPGLNIVQANGRVGQQDVFHVHLHLLPRFAADAVRLYWPPLAPPRADLDQMAAELRGWLANPASALRPHHPTDDPTDDLTDDPAAEHTEEE